MQEPGVGVHHPAGLVTLLNDRRRRQVEDALLTRIRRELSHQRSRCDSQIERVLPGIGKEATCLLKQHPELGFDPTCFTIR